MYKYGQGQTQVPWDLDPNPPHFLQGEHPIPSPPLGSTPEPPSVYFPNRSQRELVRIENISCCSPAQSPTKGFSLKNRVPSSHSSTQGPVYNQPTELGVWASLRLPVRTRHSPNCTLAVPLTWDRLPHPIQDSDLICMK